MGTAFFVSVVLALITTSQGCNIAERRQAAAAAALRQAGGGSGAAAGLRRELPPPPSLLGSPAKIISDITAFFNPAEEPSQEAARSSQASFATYGSDPDHQLPPQQPFGPHEHHEHEHHGGHERSDDLDVSGTESKESNDISSILAQLGPNSNVTADDVTALSENELAPVDGCCWKIRVDFTTGHGFYGAYKIHESMFGAYIMEPGLVNGKHHYTSSDPHNKEVYAVAYCGGQWWIQPSRLRGECNGYAYSGLSSEKCVNEIGYTWAYYVPPINQYVLAKKGLSIWCDV